MLFATLVVSGHVATAVWVLNFAYGHAVPRVWLRRLRKAHLVWLATTTVPLALWVLVTDNPLPVTDANLISQCVGWYAAACALVGVALVLPINVLRLLRSLPVWELSNHTKVVDIERELGYRPIGNGPKARFARFPWNEQFQLEVIEKEFCLPRTPVQLDGLMILHLTDFHFSGSLEREFFEQVLEQTRHWEPDLVCLTGDFIDNPDCYDWIPELLGPLKGRHGKFALLGNHDGWFDVSVIRSKLAEAGYQTPGPEGVQIVARGARLHVASTEWPWLGPLPQPAPRSQCDFALLLAHSPDCVPRVAGLGYDLVLCGHNHGGQVRLPVIGPVYMPSRYSRRFDMGPFQIGDVALYVNKGISGEHPLRFGARPEVTLIRLRSPQSVS